MRVTQDRASASGLDGEKPRSRPRTRSRLHLELLSLLISCSRPSKLDRMMQGKSHFNSKLISFFRELPDWSYPSQREPAADWPLPPSCTNYSRVRGCRISRARLESVFGVDSRPVCFPPLRFHPLERPVCYSRGANDPRHTHARASGSRRGTRVFLRTSSKRHLTFSKSKSGRTAKPAFCLAFCIACKEWRFGATHSSIDQFSPNSLSILELASLPPLTRSLAIHHHHHYHR